MEQPATYSCTEWYQFRVGQKNNGKEHSSEINLNSKKKFLCLKQKAFKIIGRMLQSMYLVEKSKELRRNGFLGC